MVFGRVRAVTVFTTVNTVTQHAHYQEAAHPNGAQSSLSTQKVGSGTS
jgi:hypothetical protein